MTNILRTKVATAAAIAASCVAASSATAASTTPQLSAHAPAPSAWKPKFPKFHKCFLETYNWAYWGNGMSYEESVEAALEMCSDL